ncbi:MAG TPA: hypothetical protein VN788_03300 [Verrucomicrobiae bacterium]|nr:hypothetical protein [Verrucomicrobiae bacterium]
MVLSGGPVFYPPCSEPTQLQETLARRAGIGKMAVAFEALGWWTPPIKPAQKNRGYSLDDSAWGASQGI